MAETQYRIVVHVKIHTREDGKHHWHFDCEYEGFCHKTGKISLKNPGQTEITYLLWGYEYQLIFVNLDPKHCAERQIHTVLIDSTLNALTIIDANAWGPVGTNPISVRLVARKKNDIHHSFMSPDPEVQNDPPHDQP